ncbi:MAG: glycosyltransferase [Nitrospirae bacterium]|nr:glycosyltransferase [Nitrospirota bacterium]
MREGLAMRIALPAYDVAGWTAGAVFTEMILRALRLAGGDDVDIVVLCDHRPGARDRWSGLATAVVPPRQTLVDRAVMRFDGHFPDAVERYCHRAGVDALLLYTRLAARHTRFRRIPWIPDFQHRSLAEYFSDRELAERDKAHRRCARLSDAMLFSSQAVCDDFARYHPAHAAKGRVARFPSLYAFCPPEGPVGIGPGHYGMPDKFILVANQYWIHKNHGVVIEALAILARRGIRAHAAFTGLPSDYRNPANANVSEMLQSIARHGLAGQVIPLGLVPKAHLTDLMRAACVVVQPSRFEGWSTVVEDAKALGRPVICSNIPVHREQAPDGLGFFDCDDPAALADILERHWDALAPGPDAAAEADGLRREQAMAEAYGHLLLDICRG